MGVGVLLLTTLRDDLAVCGLARPVLQPLYG